jgi:tyrosine aminotransferase
MDSVFESLKNVRDGVKRLAQIILGASNLAQIAIPSLLLKSSEESLYQSRNFAELMKWKSDVRSTFQEQAVALCSALKKSSPYLNVVEPQGAMYAMVHICLPYFSNEIRNDVDFMKLLLQEENVFVLPGTCFGFPDSFRIVFCAPVPVLTEAARRICQFCRRHLNVLPIEF